MGFIFSKAWTDVFKRRNRDVKLIMVGLDAAGKTTVLYQLKMNETVKTIPTIGFNVENITFRGLNFCVWDIGGQDKIRVLWKHYYQNIDGIIYVIDSNDNDRIEESAEELNKILAEDELKDSALLVMANKQDLKNSMTPKDLTEKLELSKIKDRPWLVQGTSATTGQGLKEGFDWMASTLLKKK